MDPIIVEGVGTIVISEDASLAEYLETVMVQEILACMNEGITDPAVIRARQLVAKDRAYGRYQSK